MKRVLVTGATGFIGYALARHLSGLGLRPRLLVRRPLRADLLAGLDAEPVQGDLSSPASLRRAVRGVDTVFHLGARASFESYARLRSVNVDGSVALMEAAADAEVEKFVFASSLFVHASQEAPIDADTVPRPALDYGRTKLEAERRLAEMAATAGIALGCVRLPHVYGAHALLFRQIRQGFVVFPGAMTNRCGHLHVADAVRALTEAGRRGWCGASAVADSGATTWKEFFDVVTRYYPRFRLIRLPEWLARAGAIAARPFVSLRSHPSLFTTGTVVGFNLNLPVEPTALWSELGLRPSFPTVEEGIPAVLDGSLRFRWRHPLLDRAA